MTKTKTVKSDQKLHLIAEKRTTFGKQLRKLRHGGKIPSNIFGPDFKSLSISIEGKEFNKIHKAAGETGVVYVDVEKQEIPVLIRQVQHHPINNHVIHVDFRKIDLLKKLETTVPIRIVNEAPAVHEKNGVLLTQTDHVIVEALPDDIPHDIEVDVSKLTEIGAEIKIKDLTQSPKYVFKDDPEKILILVTAHKEESVTPETTQEAPEVLTEKVEEGEQPVEESKETPKEKAQEEKKEEKKEKKQG
ncbi:MAG: 50S ribosomal protein L25 [Patescibacteria group bacterium]